MKKAMAVAVGLALVLGLCLVGCGGNNNAGGTSAPASAGGSAPASTPADGSTGGDASTGGDDAATPVNKKDAIVVASVYNINKIDPQFPVAQWEWPINMAVYDSLFHPPGFDYDNLQPALCESYELSDDGLEYIFHLRQGVQFHNGSTLTADDVVYTIERAMTSPTVASNVQAFETVEAVDEYTVKLVQKYSSPDTLKVLAEHYLGIVNKAAVEEYGDGAAEAVIGTGPYKLTDWSQDAVELDYFEDYYGAAPEIRRVTFRVIPDYSAAAIATRAGEVDILTYALPNDELGFIEDDTFDTNAHIRDKTMGVTMNNQLAPFDDVNVRRAICHAIDREAVNTIVADGRYDTSNHVKTPPDAPGYAKAEAEGRITKYDYDPEKAKALLAEAGYDDSNPLNATFICPSVGIAQTYAAAVQGELAKVNINIDVETMEGAVWTQRTATGDFEMSYNDCGFYVHRASLAYYFQYAAGTFYNRENTNIPRVNELLQQGLSEMDPEASEEIYAEVLEIVSEQAISHPGMLMGGCIITTKGLVAPADRVVGMVSIKDCYWQ